MYKLPVTRTNNAPGLFSYPNPIKSLRIKSLEYESRPETKARRKKYNHDNKEKFDPIRKDWSKAHPERIKAYNNKQVKLLSKAYVIDLLSKQGFNRKDITPELIETERAIIQTKRILWNR